MFSVLFFALLVVSLAAIGRVITPRRERLPVRQWTVRDLVANTLRGGHFLLTCSDRVESVTTAFRPPQRPDRPSSRC